ncbi:MAG: PDZ domain-containing protein [Candidatus Saccharicenans sp.]|nr:PDZ domain-containing protein [Candidatus Saccharicenans sp.]
MKGKASGRWLASTIILASLFFLVNPAHSKPVPSADRDASEIVKKVAPSVVRVEVRNGLRRVATGVVIDKDGYIATTALVSPKGEKLSVVDSGGKSYEAVFLGFDPETRIAFVQVKDKKLTPVNPGSTRNLSPGSWVCALGISPDAGISVTQGIVSSLSAGRMRLNLWLAPGMSGGPVLDEKGDFVGLLRGVYSEDRPIVFQFRDREATGTGVVYSQAEAPSAGMAMAIPVEMVMEIFREIKTRGRVERGWLGVSIAEDRQGKVFITQVEEKSPAEQARLKPGDRILKIGGREIVSSDQLVAEIRSRRPGQEVNLSIETDGETREVKVKLGSVPEEQARRELELRFPELFRNLPKFPERPVLPEFPGGEKFEFGFEHYRYIGVYIEQLNPELSKYFGVPEGRGLLIARVNAGSPAEKAGLKVGDVIIAADGRRVETLEALTDEIQKKKKGEKISLEIIRDKKKMRLEVEVAEEKRPGWPGTARIYGKPGEWPEALEKYRDRVKKSVEKVIEENKEQLMKIQEELERIKPEVEKNLQKLQEETGKLKLEIFFPDSIRKI